MVSGIFWLGSVGLTKESACLNKHLFGGGSRTHLRRLIHVLASGAARLLIISLDCAFTSIVLFRWAYLGLILLWSALQYRAHWHPLLFGASPERVHHYNEAFSRYWYLLPRSSRRVVPDGYHTIVHVLLVLNLAAVIRELW